MRENRTYGSEGGEAQAFPTPISSSLTFPTVAANAAESGRKSTGREGTVIVYPLGRKTELCVQGLSMPPTFHSRTFGMRDRAA